MRGCMMIKNILAVAAGKGGVGKSTVTAQLAYQLSALGFKVGVLDADLYGPSQHKMLSVTLPIGVSECGCFLQPAYAGDIALVSMAFWPEAEHGLFVRAPLANNVILQMLQKVSWPELDFLLIDFPPGTGDIQLTLLQQGGIQGVIIVTTPQEVAALDVEKTMRMFNSAAVPILGIIENMAYLEKEGSENIKIFHGQMGQKLSDAFGVRFLGQLPLQAKLSEACDQGVFFPMQQWQVFAEQLIAHGASATDLLEVKKLSILEHRLQIIWKDGLVQEVSFAALQGTCPCVRCQDLPEKPLQNLQARSVHSVGKYAIQFEFETGCSRGIYTFEKLRAFY